MSPKLIVLMKFKLISPSGFYDLCAVNWRLVDVCVCVLYLYHFVVWFRWSKAIYLQRILGIEFLNSDSRYAPAGRHSVACGSLAEA